MIRKTLMSGVAALAIAGAAATLQPSKAEAGFRLHIGSHGFGFSLHAPHCDTRWRKVKIRYWSRKYHSYRYRWDWRPYRYCY
ncbi:MAG: hypothetical protein ACR2PO_21380 [Methyloligellaceae bacterium]